MNQENKFNFSRLHRFLHWSIMLCILFILLTVFLKSVWMDKKEMSTIIIKELSTKNIHIQKEEAINIAKQIREPMWNWHIYIGYVLCVIYVIRLLHIFLRGTKARNPFSNKVRTIKEKIQASTYILFYTFLGIILFTGILTEFNFSKYSEIAKNIHKFSLYAIIPFITIHLIGIFIGEKTTESGVVSAMINGGKSNK